MTGALAGLRVLELSRVLAGPWAGQILADLGATVTKIEHPGKGDDTRAWGPPYLEREDGRPSAESAYYLGANRNKQSVAIDFSTAEGRELVTALALKADVVLENFRPGALRKYGLDYETLSSRNERLIYCSITGFGQSGPRSHLGGYDFIIQALGGLMSVTGLPDDSPGGGPMKVGVPVADLCTGLYAAVGILAALESRHRTGKGQQLDLSLFDVQVAMLANQGMNYLVGGAAPGRLGNDHPNVTPCGVFRTAEGRVAFAVGNDEQFRRFCAALGMEDVAQDSRFSVNISRNVHRDELNARIAQVLATRPTEHWIAAFEKHRVPAAPVNSIDAVFDDPQATARDLRVEMQHPFGTGSGHRESLATAARSGAISLAAAVAR
ncbi:MAG TPA: CoA transferase [Steroidobacter sp.]